MIYTILLLTVLSIFMLVRNYRNRYSWLFVLMITGMSLSFLGMILNVAKLGNYQYPSHALYALDYRIYLYLSHWKINYYDTVRLQLVGIAVYLVGLPLFALEFIRRRNKGRAGQWLRAGLLALPPIGYVWFYEPETRYSFYIWLASGNGGGTLRLALQAADALHIAWILLYLFWPVWLLFSYYRHSRISFKRKQIFSLVISLLIMNGLFIAIFILGPYNQLYLYSDAARLLQFPSREAPGFYYRLLPLVMLLAVQVTAVTLILFKGIDATTIFKIRSINRNVGGLNHNLKGVFHSFKNTMFTVKILAEQAEHAYGTEDGLKAIRRLQQISEASLSQSAKVIDAIKEINVRPSRCRIVNVVEDALGKLNVGEAIRIDKRYAKFGVSSYIDSYHMTEAVANLLNNAVEAIQAARREEGEIRIEIDAEGDWATIAVTDNGTGIEKKARKQIFNAFYTTKSKHENWGIGLSYVNRIVKAHLGFITVTSEKGKYTTFRILLPVDGEGSTSLNGGYTGWGGSRHD
ncbi:sensor histidine kinase [Cohnella phaseoli]|uniref:histidine kinase n=1 Tax=Cohnella phaseoli TaxID=456490 RepID=A0A3D9JTZ6_9BACL|nr:ATP-binding protein [Cohnella phaseoli]RED77591.1 signal transduction histidine kinase [Cohnella phaseoli]